MKDKILELRKNGKSYNEISRILNCSKGTISYHCKGEKMNISPTVEEIKEMNEYYFETKNIKKVSEKFDWCYTTVRKYISKIDITTDEYKIKKKKDRSDSVIRWRKDKKIKLVEYKGGCCTVCGYKKSMWALEFHHLDPNEKDFRIGGNTYSFEKLKKESDKCVLVCANCHVEIHEEIKKFGYSKILKNLNLEW